MNTWYNSGVYTITRSIMFFGLFGKKKEEMAEMPMTSADMSDTTPAPAMAEESAMGGESEAPAETMPEAGDEETPQPAM